ncbi:MAG: sensor protein [Gemmatimonadetes bacterium]|nr:sensor protein [Gemmatimonadota bacterium]
MGRPESRSVVPLTSALPGDDALYRLLVEHVTDYAIAVLTPDGRVASWNEGAERMMGWSEAEVMGEHFARFYPADEAEDGAPGRDLRRAADEGRCEALAWRVRKDGSRLWATTVLTAMRDPGGRLLGFGQITRDLTDRKEAADRYEESRQRWRSLFEHNPDAVFSLDLSGDVQGANPAAAALFGYGVDELTGAPLEFLVAAADRERVRTLFAGSAAGEPQYADLSVPHRTGRTLELSISLVPIRTGDTIVGVYCIAEDITARRLAEAEREVLLLRERIARAEAEAASRAKSDFLAVVTHELKTPLNAITGFAELLGDGDAGPLAPGQERCVERIRGSARHLLRMVDEVLGYVRMESADGGPGLAPVDLNELVRGLADDTAPAALAKGLALRLDLAGGPFVVQTDRGRVAQLVAHLLENGVKFTESGEVRVGVRREPGAAVVEVRDTGIGIAAEALEKIWEPFWQAEHPLVRRHGGTGLGLSVARRLAGLLGGDVGVDSRPGEGSTFTLRLPATGASARNG